MKERGLSAGVSDHNGWAVLVTVAADGAFVDRRRVRLIDDGLPCMPYHHDAQKLPPTVAERLADYRAQNAADTVAYRNARAGAAA